MYFLPQETSFIFRSGFDQICRRPTIGQCFGLRQEKNMWYFQGVHYIYMMCLVLVNVHDYVHVRVCVCVLKSPTSESESTL